MSNRIGAGNWIVKTLNGVGLVAIFAAVAMGAMKWGDVNRLETDVAIHCQQQDAALTKQSQIDNQQDKTVQMYNEALIRIEGKMEAMKEQQEEIKAILRNMP